MATAWRRLWRPLRSGVFVSVLFHSALVAGLFFVAGIAQAPAPRVQTSLLRAAAERPEEIEPEPPPLEAPAERPRPPEEAVTPTETPPVEPPLFTEKVRAPTSDAPFVPTDLPRSVNRPTIGIGGGAAGGGGEPAAPPPPPKPATPPPPPSRAKPKTSPAPVYPPAAVRHGLEGQVVLIVEVLPDGSVGEITVTVSSGHPILDRAALAAVREWEFSPALVRGVPARSLVEVPFSFRLE